MDQFDQQDGPLGIADHAGRARGAAAVSRRAFRPEAGGLASQHRRWRAATYKRACLVCHDADIIEQQKLSKTGWTRSVEKMMRWGASVTEADKEPLVDYLASKYPPR